MTSLSGLFLTIGALFFGIPSEAPASNGTATAASASKPSRLAAKDASRPAEFKLISSYADMRGHYMEAAGLGPVQIVEFRWGLDKNSVLRPALVRVIDKDGNLIVRDDREKMPKLFNDLDDIRGFFFTANGSRVFVDEFKLCIDPDGYVASAGMRGVSLTGAQFSRGLFEESSAFQTPACTCRYVLGCEVFDCSDSQPCPEKTYPCGCGGTGLCAQTSICACPPNGYCAPGTGTCKVDHSKDPPECFCTTTTP